MTQSEVPYDVRVSVFVTAPHEQAYLEDLEQLEGAATVQTTERVGVNTTKLADADVTEDVKSRLFISEDGYNFNLEIISMDDKMLRDYMEKAGIKPEVLSGGGLSGILINTFNLKEDNIYTTVTQMQDATGKSLVMDGLNANHKFEPLGGGLKIVATSSLLPDIMGSYLGSIATLTLVTSMESMDLLTQQMQQLGNTRRVYTVYLTGEDPSQLERSIEDLKNLYRPASSYTYNIAESRKMTDQMLFMMDVFLYGFVTLISCISIANIFNTISTGVALRKREFAMLKSVGITPGGFRKMLNYESFFYGFKALLYGIPISILINWLLYHALARNFDFGFTLPWFNLFIAIVAVFLVVGSTMIYAGRKVKGDNIIDALKNECQ